MHTVPLGRNTSIDDAPVTGLGVRISGPPGLDLKNEESGFWRREGTRAREGKRRGGDRGGGGQRKGPDCSAPGDGCRPCVRVNYESASL